MTRKKARILALLRREPVLVISAGCALAAAVAAGPGGDYLGYLDLRVLCLLFCLMAVVAGLERGGLFQALARRLLDGERSLGTVRLILVLLPFFTSMLVTNDVALITFVPFALLVLEGVGRRGEAIRVVVLQTVAANLGSMATPVGNPQNLFLYGHYQLSPGQFFSAVLPVAAAGLVVLIPACLWRGGDRLSMTFSQAEEQVAPQAHLYLCGGLFVLCLFTVFRLVPYPVTTGIVAVTLLLWDRRLLGRVDYGLLLTFVCFFCFSGDVGRLPGIGPALGALMERGPLLLSAAVSQGLSNVPAAVLLAPMTEDWRGLLLGVDIGGLGTPVASLASLISLKLYAASQGARVGRYLLWFTVANAVGLVLLIPLGLLLAG